MLEEILGSKIKIKILRKLYNEDRELNFDEIGKSLDISFGSVHPALNSLLKTRIIVFKKIGRSKLYTINNRHPLFRDIANLFRSEKEAFQNIIKNFVKRIDKKGVRNIVLFGSVAREKYTEKSDIDVLIIHSGDENRVRNNIDIEINKFLDLYDIEIVPVYISSVEFSKRKKILDRFILSILNEGKILYGDKKWLEK